ncbi:MAG: outer membrane protein assembly factor [Devosia sp.]|nr:outer membrane protein assembly factor [Devosia sp.]
MNGDHGENGNGPLSNRLVRSVLLGTLLLGSTTPGAFAFEIFGLTLFEDQSALDADAVIADPQPYVLTLSVAGGDTAVEAAIRNASSLSADAAVPASGAAGLLAKARGDYRRILAALYAEGYYGGNINILVGGREADDLPPDADLPDPVGVEIIVAPGPVFRFNRVTIVNRAPVTTDPADSVELPEFSGYAAGQIAKSGTILAAETLSLEAWRQQGYAGAAIVSRDVVADHASATVDVTITVAPGQFTRLGEITTTGSNGVDADFIVSQTGLVPGAEYDPDDLKRAEKRLAHLEVFRAMRVDTPNSASPDGLLPVTAIVEDLPPRRIGAGATYSTTDGLGVEAFHLWRNLFGRAERLRLDARIAGIGFPVNTAEFDYAFGGTFTKPGFFNPDTDLIAAISAERTVLPTYTETSGLAKLGISQVLTDEIAYDVSAFYEYARFDEPERTRDFSLLGFVGGVTFDNRDEPTNATEGFYLNLTAEPFYEFYYGNPVFRTTAEVRGYLGLGDDDFVVLAGRLKAGALVGAGLDEIPPDRTFLAGGGGSVRGYPYRSIGVTNADGTVTGGRYLLEASVEARVKIMKDIGIVAFLDGGIVAADEIPSLDQLRLGAGIGLRYETGFGPLRLDLAVPLNKRPGDPDYALYVGIGQAF